jgi:hypothetical protein
MAYTTATIVKKDAPTQEGRVHLVIEFTGDAGEPPVQRDYVLDSDSTVPAIRTWVRDTITMLAGRKSIASNPSVAVGQVIPPAAADPAPTAGQLAQQLYFSDAARLVHMKQLVDAGGMLASNTEFVALQTSVKATYLASYATSF